MIWRRSGTDGGGSDKALEGRVNKLLDGARDAGARGDLAAQARFSGEATDVCRTLVDRHPGDARHAAALAGGLYNHAYRLIQVGRPAEARDALTESHRHYATLAAADPGRYAVPVCDVRLRTALTFVVEGRFGEAVRTAREVLGEYEAATAGDDLEREFGLVRTHALIGRALLLDPARRGTGEALEEFDTALFAGERLREEIGVGGTDFGWLAAAPASFRQAAPEWLGAAVAAMELHDAAGRWGVAADAANVAMRVAGGLAALGDERAVQRFEAIMERAQEVWWSAQHPMQAAAQRAGPTDEVMVGGAQLIRGPHLEPDLRRIATLSGWGTPPS